MGIIEIHDLVKVFNDKEVISHCNMNVKKGTIYGFLGANGAGKTTLLKLIAGLLKPTSGKITISGMSIEKDRNILLKEIGTLIEVPAFYEHLSAEDNLKIHLSYMDCPKTDINSTLTKVGLENVDLIPVSKYSLGMKQRLAIARAIIHNPHILLLDEPINGLDPLGIKQMRSLVLSLSKESGMTIIISSHILSEIEQIADTIGIIKNGTIIEEIQSAEILKDNAISLEDYYFSKMEENKNA